MMTVRDLLDKLYTGINGYFIEVVITSIDTIDEIYSDNHKPEYLAYMIVDQYYDTDTLPEEKMNAEIEKFKICLFPEYGAYPEECTPGIKIYIKN